MTSRRLPEHPSLFEHLEQRLCFSTLPPIAVPTDLSATPLSDTSVLLQWTDIATDELRYIISRSTNNHLFINVANTHPGAFTYVDQTTDPDTEYFYKIRTQTRIGVRENPTSTRVTTLSVDEDPFALFDFDSGQLDVRGTSRNDVLGLSAAGGVLSADLDGNALTFAQIDVYRISILTYDGDDRISIASGVGAVRVAGGRGDDSIFANSGDDRLDGGPGNDSIKGNAGNDTITGGDGNDIIYGQAGMDVIRGGKGADKLVGGDDNDSIFGEAGDDRLYGQLGIDSLQGNGGNNFIQQD